MGDNRGYCITSDFAMVVAFNSAGYCGGGYRSCGDDKDLQTGYLTWSVTYPVIHTALSVSVEDDSKMKIIFDIVYCLLKQLSVITGLTYNEINIVLYYIIIPMIYFVMIDRIMKKHVFKIGFSIIVLITLVFVDLNEFSNSLFDASVKFLLLFDVIGWNYVVSSVIVCVVVPVIIFGVLFYFSYWSSVKKYLVKKPVK
ncbi:MAG: hypothetical protein APR63_05270 [Desulfuromonas sp. SDB]|nr:MAG: hypothetical protein APR63_05270 [Desulfuromonas sp. SDB]